MSSVISGNEVPWSMAAEVVVGIPAVPSLAAEDDFRRVTGAAPQDDMPEIIQDQWKREAVIAVGNEDGRAGARRRGVRRVYGHPAGGPDRTKA